GRAIPYTSFTRGAVLIDDVTIDKGAGAVVFGNFELAEQGGVGAIDNRNPLPGGLTSADVWRSTGKPVSPNWHAEALANLQYNDLCGPSNSPARQCNIGGVVVTAGNHDNNENAGDDRYLAFREISQDLVSPTIDLVTPPLNAPNEQGITASIANATRSIRLRYELYTGMFNIQFTGESWTVGVQMYPSLMPNGGKCWG